MSESRSGNDRETFSNDEDVQVDALGHAALQGHEADEAETSAVAGQKHSSARAGHQDDQESSVGGSRAVAAPNQGTFETVDPDEVGTSIAAATSKDDETTAEVHPTTAPARSDHLAEVIGLDAVQRMARERERIQFLIREIYSSPTGDDDVHQATDFFGF